MGLLERSSKRGQRRFAPCDEDEIQTVRGQQMREGCAKPLGCSSDDGPRAELLDDLHKSKRGGLSSTGKKIPGGAGTVLKSQPAGTVRVQYW